MEKDDPNIVAQKQIEEQIERMVDTQGISYADARERLLGNTRPKRTLGGEATRRMVKPVSHVTENTELTLDW